MTRYIVEGRNKLGIAYVGAFPGESPEAVRKKLEDQGVTVVDIREAVLQEYSVRPAPIAQPEAPTPQ
jgi:type II secretory pathway component PulF